MNTTNMKLLIIGPLYALLMGCATSLKTGDALYREGYYTEAVKSLSEFVSNNPQDAIGHYTLADSLYLKYSSDYAKNRANSNDINLSSSHFSKAIKLDPNYAEAYSQRGVVRLVLGDVSGSKQDYERAIQLKPTLDRVYFNRAYWFEKQNRYSDAIADYRKYISLSNNNAWRDDAARRIEALEMKMLLRGNNKSIE